jgi:hypothetical protein
MPIDMSLSVKLTSALLPLMLLEGVLGAAVKRGRNWGGLTAPSLGEAEPAILPLVREGVLPLVHR